jgi:tetratricopeptide (TPR) repeat protein
MQLAEEFYAANDFTGAEKHLRSELKANPKNANAHYLLGNILLKQNRPEEAKKEFGWVMMLEPSGTARKYSQQALEQLSKPATAAVNPPPQIETASGARSSTQSLNDSLIDATNNTAAIKNSTVNVSRQADEREQALNAERDQRIKEVMKEAERQTKIIEDEMHEAIDANGQATYGFRRRMVYNPAPLNDTVRQEYQPKIDRIKEDARKKIDEIKTQYALRAEAVERTAISVDQSYVKQNQNTKVMLRPHGTDMYTRNYQTAGEPSANPVPVQAAPGKLLPGLTNKAKTETKSEKKKENQ